MLYLLLQTFMVVVAVESLTYFLLAMILHKFPSPITAMLLSPVTLLALVGSFACCLAVSGCCDDRLDDGQNSGNRQVQDSIV